jgi:hypothetical protein
MSKNLLLDVLSVLIPESLSAFELVSVNEYADRIELRLDEPSGCPPASLSGKDVILDGFTNPLELQTFPLKDKPVYFKVYRRRWKEKGTNNPHNNSYDLHPEKVKATHEFAAFLKDEVGQTLGEYNAFWGFPAG